jgi:hypothetical protein
MIEREIRHPGGAPGLLLDSADYSSADRLQMDYRLRARNLSLIARMVVPKSFIALTSTG